jgi:hypothetical protein
MVNQHFVWLDDNDKKIESERIEAHRWRAHSDHLRGTLLCHLLCAFLLILKSDSFIQLPGDAKLLGNLTFAILFILNEEIRAVPPALAAAYAALSID